MRYENTRRKINKLSNKNQDQAENKLPNHDFIFLKKYKRFRNDLNPKQALLQRIINLNGGDWIDLFPVAITYYRNKSDGTLSSYASAKDIRRLLVTEEEKTEQLYGWWRVEAGVMEEKMIDFIKPQIILRPIGDEAPYVLSFLNDDSCYKSYLYEVHHTVNPDGENEFPDPNYKMKKVFIHASIYLSEKYIPRLEKEEGLPQMQAKLLLRFMNTDNIT